MRIPRFGTKSLLITVTVVVLWLSTLSGFTGSKDIQAFIWTAIVVTSGVAAASYRGRRRAFWLGFFGTMVLMHFRTGFTVYGAKLTWTTNASRELATMWQGEPRPGQLVQNIYTTLIFLTLLVCATAIGFLSALVFDHCQRSENHEAE